LARLLALVEAMPAALVRDALARRGAGPQPGAAGAVERSR
jgi:hypothetical protein